MFDLATTTSGDAGPLISRGIALSIGVSRAAIERVLNAAATAYEYAHEVAGGLADGSIGYIELSTTSR